MNYLKKFVNFKYYSQVYNKPLKTTYCYIFLLSLIIYFISIGINFYLLSRFFDQNVISPIKSWPSFAIQDGILSVTPKEPIEIEVGSILLIVDSLESINTEKYSSKGDRLIVFTQENIKLINNDDVREVKYSSLLGSLKLKSIDKTYFIKTVTIIGSIIKKYYLLLSIVLYFVWIIFFKIWSVLLLWYIAIHIDDILRSKLSYHGLFSIVAHVIAIPWILKLIYYEVGLDKYIPWLIYFVLYWTIGIFCTFKIIKEIQKQQKIKNDEDKLNLEFEI